MLTYAFTAGLYVGSAVGIQVSAHHTVSNVGPPEVFPTKKFAAGRSSRQSCPLVSWKAGSRLGPWAQVSPTRLKCKARCWEPLW